MEEETAVAAALAFAEMGYERVVNTITFAIHQLAENPSLQDKVREELRILKGSQRRLSYEILVKAEWLHAVVLGDLLISS